MMKLTDQAMKLQDDVHNAKIELNATVQKKSQIEQQITKQQEQDKNLTAKVANEQE